MLQMNDAHFKFSRHCDTNHCADRRFLCCWYVYMYYCVMLTKKQFHLEGDVCEGEGGRFTPTRIQTNIRGCMILQENEAVVNATGKRNSFDQDL